MIINTANLTSATKTVRGLFLTALSGAASLVPNLTMPASTTTGEAIFGWLGNLPSMKPFVKELEKQTLAASDWSVSTTEYAMGYSIPMLALRRDQFGIYAPAFQTAGQRAGWHRDKLLADRLIAGFTAKDYTGKNFFDTAKKWVKGSTTTFDNKLTKVLTLPYFRQARQMLRGMKDPAGYPLHPNPQFRLIVGPDLEGTAKDLLKSDRLDGGATNTERDAATLEVWGFLGGGEWFLTIDNYAIKPFINLSEINLDLYSLTDMKSEAGFNRHELEYQAYGVYGIDFGLPQLIVGSTGADA